MAAVPDVTDMLPRAIWTGRCGLPCRLGDSRVRGTAGPKDHLCILEPWHPGRGTGGCDYIRPCAASKKGDG